MFRNWIQLMFDAALLGVEAQRVIGLRLMKLSAGGPAAQAEALRMVSEKTAGLSGSRDDARPRWLSGDCHTTLPIPCQIEQATLVKAWGDAGRREHIRSKADRDLGSARHRR